jgi:hypothetical protein
MHYLRNVLVGAIRESLAGPGLYSSDRQIDPLSPYNAARTYPMEFLAVTGEQESRPLLIASLSTSAWRWAHVARGIGNSIAMCALTSENMPVSLAHIGHV